MSTVSLSRQSSLELLPSASASSSTRRSARRTSRTTLDITPTDALGAFAPLSSPALPAPSASDPSSSSTPPTSQSQAGFIPPSPGGVGHITGAFDSTASPLHQFLSLGKALRDRLDSPLYSPVLPSRASPADRAAARKRIERALRRQWGEHGWAAMKVWDAYVRSGYTEVGVTQEQIEQLSQGGRCRIQAVVEADEAEGTKGPGHGSWTWEEEEERMEGLRRCPSMASTEEAVEEHTQAGACAELAGYGIKVRDYYVTGPLHKKAKVSDARAAAGPVPRLEVLVTWEDVLKSQSIHSQSRAHTGGASSPDAEDATEDADMFDDPRRRFLSARSGPPPRPSRLSRKRKSEDPPTGLDAYSYNATPPGSPSFKKARQTTDADSTPPRTPSPERGTMLPLQRQRSQPDFSGANVATPPASPGRQSSQPPSGSQEKTPRRRPPPLARPMKRGLGRTETLTRI